MNVPDNLKYMESHEWVNATEDGTATVGVSDHAQAELTDVVYLELPAVGKTVAKGDPIAVIESVKAANDIYSPVSGEVIESNEALENEPELVNSDPFGAGWMFKIKLSDSSELESLMGADAYTNHIS